MTRLTIPRFLRRTLTAGLALAALAVPLALMGASSASAATTWLPPLHPESFSIFVSTFDQNGSVDAFGPVHGFGHLTEVSDTFVVLDLHNQLGTVNVKHSPEAPGRIDWRACTESAVTYGTWQFVGGTGHDWGATGFGHFREIDFSVLQRGRYGQCEPFKAPRYFQTSVEASGLAAR